MTVALAAFSPAVLLRTNLERVWLPGVVILSGDGLGVRTCTTAWFVGAEFWRWMGATSKAARSSIELELGRAVCYLLAIDPATSWDGATMTTGWMVGEYLCVATMCLGLRR